VKPLPWPEEENKEVDERPVGRPVGRRDAAGRRVAAVLGALLVAVVGLPMALLLLWVAAWNWEPWQRSDADRQKFVGGAVAVVAATVGLMVLILWRGFRDPTDRRRR
jgi:hypothetical protein